MTATANTSAYNMTKRIESVDVLRGLTMAFMLVVDNPGGVAFAPLEHADWNGFTPTDFVFPAFVFVMGVSMYLSLRKQEFKLSWKVLRRFVLLFGLGLLCNWIGKCVWNGAIVGVENLRILGVLQRLALCYGVCALLVCTVKHRWLGWVAGGILAAYSAILLLGNGYVHGPENILARVDAAVLGTNHLYKADNGVDPEGLLSTLPAVAHTLIGFLVGKMLLEKDLRKMDAVGTLLLAGGFLLSFLLPVNKKVWSPSFVLVCCGAATLLLCLFHWLIDEKGVWKHTGFWKTFGSNAILCFLLCEVLVWGMHLTGWHGAVMGALGNNEWTSLLYALCGVLVVYLLVLPLYRNKIYVKL